MKERLLTLLGKENYAYYESVWDGNTGDGNQSRINTLTAKLIDALLTRIEKLEETINE